MDREWLAEADRDGLGGGGLAPDVHGAPALDHHVVGEQAGEPDFGGRGGGEQQDSERRFQDRHGLNADDIATAYNRRLGDDGYGTDLSYIHDVGFGGYVPARRLDCSNCCAATASTGAGGRSRVRQRSLGGRSGAEGYDVLGFDLSPAMIGWRGERPRRPVSKPILCSARPYRPAQPPPR